VLGVTTIAQAMAALRTLCNGTGTPDFSKLQIGDYLDGIDLSGIAASAANTAGQAWNNTYKNNRIVISAFNPYKGVGDTEVTKNHIQFDFANVPLRGRMNPTNINAGGYTASEMRVFLDGLNGDGTGDFVYASSPENPVIAGAFLAALIAQIGDYIIPVRKLLDESIFDGTQTWAWRTYRLFLHSENDVFGANAWGRPGYGDGQKLHIPLYRDSYAYRIKRYNGSRDWWWLNTSSPVLRPISVVSTAMVMPTATMRLLWVAAPPLSVLRSNTDNPASRPPVGREWQGISDRENPLLPPRSGGRFFFNFLIGWFL
jgi:hypothetical protein